MKVQGNRYINNPEMIKNKVEKKTTVPQNIISEDDVKISDSARKLVETARNKVSDFHTMHFSSIMGEIREIPAEYKCENLFKLDFLWNCKAHLKTGKVSDPIFPKTWNRKSLPH